MAKDFELLAAIGFYKLTGFSVRMAREFIERSWPILGIYFFVVGVSLWTAFRTSGWQSVFLSALFDVITFCLGFFAAMRVMEIGHSETKEAAN